METPGLAHRNDSMFLKNSIELSQDFLLVGYMVKGIIYDDFVNRFFGERKSMSIVGDKLRP